MGVEKLDLMPVGREPKTVLEILQEQCSVEPFDPGVHGALADLLEDDDAARGLPFGANGMSAALRWMARTGFRPARRKKAARPYAWAWWHARSLRSYPQEKDARRLDILAHPEAVLPLPLFAAMAVAMCETYGIYDHWYARSWEECVNALDGGVRLLTLVAAGEVRPAAKGGG